MAGLLALVAVAPAEAQSVSPLPELTPAALQRWLDQQHGAVRGCSRDTTSWLARVDVSVRGQRGPSTMDDARIVVRVQAEPRSAEIERCVSRALQGALRRLRFATSPATVRASRVFEIRPPRRNLDPLDGIL